MIFRLPLVENSRTIDKTLRTLFPPSSILFIGRKKVEEERGREKEASSNGTSSSRSKLNARVVNANGTRGRAIDKLDAILMKR